VSTSNSSKNALSHGAYSSLVILPWEDLQQFEELHKSFQEDLDPNGALEEETVFDLACLHWKKRRLNVGSQLPFLRDRNASALTDASRRDGWQGIADHFTKTLDNNESARDAARSINKAFREMAVKSHELFTKHVQQTFAHGGTNQASVPSDTSGLEKLTAMMSEMRAWSNTLAPALRIIENFCLDENPCEQAYRPDLLEKEQKVLADIDKRIDKAMARLVNLKEYKNLYGPKEVKALPAKVITLPAKGQASELRGSQESSPSNDGTEPTT
jgi:hypothetical protein